MTDPFTPSPELAAIAKRWLHAYAGRQTEAAANLFSRSAAITYVGSDDGELLTAPDFHKTFVAFCDDQAVLVPENIEVTAYEAGSFGWALSTLTIVAPDADKSVTFRNTFIFALEDAVWRIVHIHNSNPKPNMEAMGYTSRSIEELTASLQSEALELGHTGIASVMFTDIVDSTALAAATGDATWSSIVQTHMAEIGEAITAHGGTLVKSLGDGTLSSFSSASAALNAATRIQQGMQDQAQEPHLRVRIGIHTGDVVERDGDYIGTVVNTAARVAAAAAPEEIRVSDPTRAMVGGNADFAFGDPVSVQLKGLAGEHLIHKLEWRV
ncbi:nuclear transport factor 2 family protein [Tropicibacter sp. R16_0]|uniref:adenylate/guanylate cyclase domain-containing protein n=1 Tax=Tropicibacter sp. R16_0 TaxID=2821102 RepID=UPI001ADA80A1|nr:adenylate/guanylate cyclase domain-containing protein [Tropicibacter sp. R16_0]MBO9449246.1 nuclear transport factor 2 family protein [Tropicibacter sp. R16_0]